jgi:hypothetical protein
VLSLAEFQAQMRACLHGGNGAEGLFAHGAVALDDGLDIYRGNILSAATNALRLTFPTVDRIVGEAFFSQLCAKRLALDPPQSANLADYCDHFPTFLHAVEHLHALPYLVDAARFDLELARVANADRHRRSARIALDAETVLVIDATLSTLCLDYPADEIREAIERDENALARIDMTRRTRWRAIWRSEYGVQLRPLSTAAGLFLRASLAERGLEAALDLAEASDAADVADEIERDIFRAPFTRILTIAEHSQ